MTTENEKLVENFLKEIKKHLPEWLKSNNEKLEDVIGEISSHIWDSAQEIAGSDEIDLVAIQEAINRLGNPKEIAKNYKKRGIPKYFISEELWSIYTKVNAYLIMITFLAIIIVQVVLVEPNNFLQALINGVTISYPVIITFMAIITIIFVGLSYEGFFPKDLGQQDETKDSKLDYFKPDEFLVGGLVGIFFGLFIIILPIDMINLIRIIINLIIGLFGIDPMAMYVVMSVEARTFLILIGIVTIITGIINILKMRTKDIGFQLIMNIGLIIIGVIDFGFALYLISNLPLFLEILPLSTNILLFLAVLAIFGTTVDVISNLAKNIKLYGMVEENNLG